MTEMTAELNTTTLIHEHERAGATLVDFHGWRMPMYYAGILKEHACVRERVGLFDVSHMGQVYLSGEAVREFAQYMFTADVHTLEPGKGQYSLMLNPNGGILDDVILFQLGDERFLLIVNCATREHDVAWIREQARGQITIDDVSAGHSIIAVQGPQAVALASQVVGKELAHLKRFRIQPLQDQWSPGWVSRTGYTGSDGVEFFIPNRTAPELWRTLLKAGASLGVAPIGLGARDTLRLEAGLRLYGSDMDDGTLPDEAGLAWVVATDKGEFCGRDALITRRAEGLQRKLVGLVMNERGAIPRAGCVITADGQAIGHVTSGSMSPGLGSAVALGFVNLAHEAVGSAVSITVRDRAFRATVSSAPFILLR